MPPHRSFLSAWPVRSLGQPDWASSSALGAHSRTAHEVEVASSVREPDCGSGIRAPRFGCSSYEDRHQDEGPWRSVGPGDSARAGTPRCALIRATITSVTNAGGTPVDLNVLPNGGMPLDHLEPVLASWSKRSRPRFSMVPSALAPHSSRSVISPSQCRSWALQSNRQRRRGCLRCRGSTAAGS